MMSGRVETKDIQKKLISYLRIGLEIMPIDSKQWRFF